MSAVDVAGVGAVTSLGLTAPQSCAAFRAGIRGLNDVFHPLLPAEPVIGGRVPASLDLRRTYSEWLVSLSVRAIAEALKDFQYVDETVLLVNMREDIRNHPELTESAVDTILAEIQQKLGVRFLAAQSVRGGRAGALLALQQAREILMSGTAKYCCVGGVDSLVNDHDIQYFRRKFRLKDAGQPWGLMPSEGAGFVLLTPLDGGIPPLARIRGIGISRVASLEEDAEASNGVGLRAAFEAALRDAGVNESDIEFTITDQNGERLRSIEYVIAETRTFRSIRERMPNWSFCQSAGDTWSAAGAMSIILATIAYQRGYAPGQLAICSGSSDDGTRAACVIGGIMQAGKPDTRS